MCKFSAKATNAENVKTIHLGSCWVLDAARKNGFCEGVLNDIAGLEFGDELGCVSSIQKPRILGMETPHVLNIDRSRILQRKMGFVREC